MATHSSVLAWRIPGTGEPGGCRLWGHTESDTSEVTAAAAAKQQRMLFTTCSENCHHLAFSYHFLLAITGHSVYLMDWCFFIPLVSQFCQFLRVQSMEFFFSFYSLLVGDQIEIYGFKYQLSVDHSKIFISTKLVHEIHLCICYIH